MQTITIGLDMAKSVFQLHGEDGAGRVVRKRLGRKGMVSFFEKHPPCVVALEACGTSHYWGRTLKAFGHEARLLPAAYVRPFVKRNKTDAREAAAICVAPRRPDIRPVPVKSEAQQASRPLERTRELRIKQPTQLMNRPRAATSASGSRNEHFAPTIRAERTPSVRTHPRPTPNAMSCGHNASAREFVYQNLAMTLGVIRILGVDPGLRATGWGVIEAAGSRLSFVGCGSIETDAAVSLAERLAAIHRLLTGLVEREGPHEAAIEETFINRDPQSALKLGQARGVALATLALTGLPVAEYAANLIKKTVVGVGHAEKRQVAMMVRMLLPASTASTPDAADALAVAICHAQHRAARASCEKVEAGFSPKSARNRRNRQSAAIRLNRGGL
jgi:crossover junction endodeoxyribonuclease RuvC